jgi:ElaB/YqjD/DUF883 family membrane-anchored ribosome-binding protein
MTTAAADTSAREDWTKVKDIKNLAADAVEEGVRAARRALKTAKRGIENAGDLRDEAAYQVKREPLKAVGLAFGAGLLVGVVASWVGWRCTMPADRRDVC